ncbi:SURF1 family protein [Occultella glacieicola]|uniref:SURF1-like protein n=1 Tax=Occultella glacieicola TaxID=2518684 RepID=A0ABY2DZJ1_9MICO|nr:SURF1 family protein [Occultella glacieicola]TDE90306.1 SURF1 family protein [Occultella glacieicola]
MSTGGRSPGRYRFLLSGRWAGIVAVAVVVSLACGGLGYWQLTRYQGKAEAIALVDANYDADPVAIEAVLPTSDSVLEDSRTWTPVTVTGHYLTDAAHPSVVLPQRPIGGSAADHVAAIFAVDGAAGETWLLTVDRGWYATDTFTDHGPQQEVPGGEVTLTVRLRPAEPLTDRDAPEGQVYGLAPAQVLTATTGDGGAAAGGDGRLVTGAYGVLADESPTTASPPNPLPRPAADLGNHLSYAFQWWIFGIGALAGAAILARREAFETHDFGPHSPNSPAARPAPRIEPPARTRRRSAEEEEDALIDAQLRERT